MNIGTVIKDYRLKKGLTLQTLSSLSCVSKSMLSEIENNKKMPSIDVVQRISHALKISILALLSNDQQKATALYTKSDDHLTLQDPPSGLSLQFISPHGSMNEPTISFGKMLPNSSTKVYSPTPFITSNYIYIVQGILNFRLGETTYKLAKGDSFYFTTETVQQLFTGSDECHFFSVRYYPSYDQHNSNDPGFSF